MYVYLCIIFVFGMHYVHLFVFVKGLVFVLGTTYCLDVFALFLYIVLDYDVVYCGVQYQW